MLKHCLVFVVEEITVASSGVQKLIFGRGTTLKVDLSKYFYGIWIGFTVETSIKPFGHVSGLSNVSIHPCFTGNRVLSLPSPYWLEKQAIVYNVFKHNEEAEWKILPVPSSQPNPNQRKKATLKCHLLFHLAPSNDCNALNSQGPIFQLLSEHPSLSHMWLCIHVCTHSYGSQRSGMLFLGVIYADLWDKVSHWLSKSRLPEPQEPAHSWC